MPSHDGRPLAGKRPRAPITRTARHVPLSNPQRSIFFIKSQHLLPQPEDLRDSPGGLSPTPQIVFQLFGARAPSAPPPSNSISCRRGKEDGPAAASRRSASPPRETRARTQQRGLAAASAAVAQAPPRRAGLPANAHEARRIEADRSRSAPPAPRARRGTVPSNLVIGSRSPPLGLFRHPGALFSSTEDSFRRPC